MAASLDARFQCDRPRYFCVDSDARARAPALKVNSSLAREFRPRCIPSHSGDQHNTRTAYAFCQAVATSTRPTYITRGPGVPDFEDFSFDSFPYRSSGLLLLPRRGYFPRCVVEWHCAGIRLKYTPGTRNVLVTRIETRIGTRVFYAPRKPNREIIYYSIGDRVFFTSYDVSTTVWWL